MKKICPVCMQTIEDGAEAITCPDCGKAYHAECWSNNGGCSNPECKGITKQQQSPGSVVKSNNACPQCGATVDLNKNFCEKCGYSLNIAKQNRTASKNNKKKIFIVLVAALLIIGLSVGLTVFFMQAKYENNNKTEKQKEENITEIKSKTEDKTESTANEYVIEEADSTVEETEAKPTVIKKGQKITIKDVCEFYIDYTNITKKVIPKYPASYYQFYDAEKGNTYIDICIAYKNLTGESVDADEVGNVAVTYDGKYKYTAFSIIEKENRGNFTYTNITDIDCLSTEFLHYLIEVPDEVINSKKTIDADLIVNENTYKIKIR